VVSVGRLWDEAKGARDLVGAAALLHGTIDVVLAGPARPPTGEPPFPVEAPGVRYAGLLSGDALASLLGRAAIYVASSRYEPFGLAPLEAALAGCALVMTDIPTFRELWDGAAEFYPPATSTLWPTGSGASTTIRPDARRSPMARAPARCASIRRNGWPTDTSGSTARCSTGPAPPEPRENRLFAHSLVSDWSHGNAHFLRGLMRALAARGHRVRAAERADGWSVRNLVADHGTPPLAEFRQVFADIRVDSYRARRAGRGGGARARDR
jgi:hypothetical protein